MTVTTVEFIFPGLGPSRCWYGRLGWVEGVVSDSERFRFTVYHVFSYACMKDFVSSPCFVRLLIGFDVFLLVFTGFAWQHKFHESQSHKFAQCTPLLPCVTTILVTHGPRDPPLRRDVKSRSTPKKFTYKAVQTEKAVQEAMTELGWHDDTTAE